MASNVKFASLQHSLLSRYWKLVKLLSPERERKVNFYKHAERATYVGCLTIMPDQSGVRRNSSLNQNPYPDSALFASCSLL
ncbi:hypothetical protein ACN38_g8026 [Penicillium nordicum]|uniref:Uncharacterized protein n=1 Tax=Penicillium nordicum TaxID=229535 RepID=A0A0M8P0M7_9EURO|nr:hypothetical protein ACN38_g8026 [Penicillium nordicum]